MLKDLLKAPSGKKFSDSQPDAVPDTAIPAANLAHEREKRILCDRSGDKIGAKVRELNRIHDATGSIFSRFPEWSILHPNCRHCAKGIAMSYKQLFLLILTIWSAELCTRLLFDALLKPQMEYRTYYLETDKYGRFLGEDINEEVGDRGWQLVSAVPNPHNKEEMILFFQRRIL